MTVPAAEAPAPANDPGDARLPVRDGQAAHWLAMAEQSAVAAAEYAEQRFAALGKRLDKLLMRERLRVLNGGKADSDNAGEGEPS